MPEKITHNYPIDTKPLGSPNPLIPPRFTANCRKGCLHPEQHAEGTPLPLGPERVQPRAVRPQPRPVRARVEAQRLHVRPEAWAVVAFQQMGALVSGDVVG